MNQSFTSFDDIVSSGKKYKIVYADPPWFYNRHDSRGCPYPMMQTEDICNLPVKQITDKDCILFIWGTFPRLQECFKVIEAWGFEYKTLGFDWIKKNKNGSLFWGMGNWTRSNSEVCLLAVKGKPKRLNADVPSPIMTEYTEHSEKPDEIRKRILRLCGDLPRIELFARTKIHGWDTFGNDHKLHLNPLEAYT